MSGYCASGSCGKENIPSSVMNTAMTPAKMGRSMKKREKRMGRRPVRARRIFVRSRRMGVD